MTDLRVKVTSAEKDEIHDQLKQLPLIQKLITERILWAKISAEYTEGQTVIKTEDHMMVITAISNSKGKIEVDGIEIPSGRNVNDFRNVVIKELIKMGFKEHILL